MLPVIKSYRKLPAKIEELESIRAYGMAKASRDTAIPFEQVIQEIEKTQRRSITSCFYAALKRSRPAYPKPPIPPTVSNQTAADWHCLDEQVSSNR
jgi:hypothetical protein